ncbi:MAG: thiazole biosynthesis adenylyltransferase ThiF [Methanobacteriota archaeon]|nr:MAG: thiazole biosynthesis adenylyltransferase ThiF [Euryarchaeota archaeon]
MTQRSDRSRPHKVISRPSVPRAVGRPDRYRRQTVLAEIGAEGQRALSRARAAVVGLGALGSISSDLLARAGVGHLRLVDRDVVELTNLQRQSLYSESDVDRPKAEAAAERLRSVNSGIDIEAVSKDAHSATARDILHGADIVLDGTDNLETRFLLNEAAIDLGIPFVYAGAIATYGMVFAIRSPDTACFRCFNPNAPPPGSLPTCETAGIFNAVSAQIGAIQAGEALRLLLGEAPSGDLLIIDGWRPEIQKIHVARRSDCPACALGEREYLGAKRAQVLVSLCGSDTISLDPVHRGAIDLEALARRLEALGSARRAGGVLVVDVEGRRLTIFPDGRALIRGVNSEAEARTVYAKYVGI